MKRWSVLSAVGLFLASSVWSWGGPLGGSIARDVLLPGEVAEPAPPYIRIDETKWGALRPLPFQGGQRASVILLNNENKMPTKLTVFIIDALGAVVAQNTGSDVCGVVWYPARTAEYGILVHCEPKQQLRCYLSIK